MTETKIYILLQEYTNNFGKVYRLLRGGSYNHASIGLDESLNEFYSFRSKWGLCVEHPFLFDKEHKKNIPCAVYEVAVSPQEYNYIKAEIAHFVREREHYHYSYLSILLGFLGIKHEFSNGYYCSRFVAQLLDNSGAVKLKKHASLYLPCDFLLEKVAIHFEGAAKEYVSQKVPAQLA